MSSLSSRQLAYRIKKGEINSLVPSESNTARLTAALQHADESVNFFCVQKSYQARTQKMCIVEMSKYLLNYLNAQHVCHCHMCHFVVQEMKWMKKRKSL